MDAARYDDPRQNTDGGMPGPVQATLEQMAVEVAQMQDALGKMHDRLRPVLSPLEPLAISGDNDPELAREPNSPTTEQLAHLVELVRIQHYHVAELLRRLEV